MDKIKLQHYWNKGISYSDYNKALHDFLNGNKWPENNYPEDYFHYVELAKMRMERIDKNGKIDDNLKIKLAKIDSPIYLLVITELWCGDAGQIIPYLNLLAENNTNIKLRLIWRDTYPELMDAYLTNGSKSIPKLIVLNPENFSEIATWGPRPSEAQNILIEFKKTNNPDKEVFYKNLQLWYAKNRGVDTVTEIIKLLSFLKE